MILFKTRNELHPEVRAIFDRDVSASHEFVDRIFAYILMAQWVFGIITAAFISPLTWTGESSQVHLHVWLAVFLGGTIVSLPIYLALTAPGKLVTRLFISAGQLTFSALLIHLMGGRIEAHFHIFASLALLSVYRDRTVFIPAVAITVIDHVVRGFLWPGSVFGALAVVPWRPFEHAAWVAFETVCLCYLIRQNLNQAASQAKLQWCLKKERDLLETRVEERTQELESSKVFQEQVLDSIDAELCLLDQAGDIIFANKRWQSFGQDDPDLQKLPAVNENFFDACEKEHDSRYNVELASAIREIRDEKRKEFLMEYSCDSGPRQRWFHLKVNRVKLSTGTAISLMQHDISGAKRDQARAASFAKLIMDSPSEVYIFDADSFRFVEINQGACNNLGYVRSEMLAMSPADIKPDFSEQQLREHCNALTTGLVDSQHFETTHERKDGSTYCVSIDLHCSTLQGRKVLVAFATDVTDRKKLEQQLGESRKLESVGQLAAGVAHEINTPMQCVFGNVEFLQTSFERLLMLSDRIVEMLEQSSVDWDEERKTLNELRESYRYDYLRAQTPDAIAEAADASNRVISIIRAMKIMSHPGSSAKSATDVHDMIQSAATITRGRWKRCAEMVFDFDPELTMVDLLPAEISQVFMNLIVNAADAIMEKIGETPSELGKITISTHCDSEWVTLCFSDTGSGMPDSVKSRIFDPFFTTKEVGRGTGQGLSICRDVIVKRHSGTLEVQSDIGSGTEFKIRIPRHCVPTHGPDQDANPIIAPVTVPAAVHSGSISVN